MSGRICAVSIAIVSLTSLPAEAGLTVSMTAQAAGGGTVDGPVAAGTNLTVDILLAVDGTDNPLRDIRSIQLDFSASSPELVLGSVTWMLDLAISDVNYVEFAEPIPSVTYLGTSRADGLILDLNSTPSRVATIEVTVNGSGVLTMLSASTSNPSSGTVISAGFSSPVIFSSAGGNIAGGTLALSVDGNPAPDTDGDGVADTADAFPLDPDETLDTDGDGAGNVADVDDDGDGVPDVDDALPLDGTESVDTDQDGVGDNADPDDDGDGVIDVDDAFPLDPTQTTETQGGGGQSGGGGSAGGSLCGVAMLSTMVFLSLGLAGLRLDSARRERRQRR